MLTQLGSSFATRSGSSSLAQPAATAGGAIGGRHIRLNVHAASIDRNVPVRIFVSLLQAEQEWDTGASGIRHETGRACDSPAWPASALCKIGQSLPRRSLANTEEGVAD